MAKDFERYLTANHPITEIRNIKPKIISRVFFKLKSEGGFTSKR